jgi:transcription antitermination factor NusG
MSVERCHVFYCRSRAEKKAKLRLEMDGFKVFLPISKELRQWSDRKKWVELPLFSGYLFVYCQPHQLFTVVGYPGVVAPVKLAGEFACIGERDIEAIERFLATGLSVEVVQGVFDLGTQVEVMGGPLKGMTGHWLSEAGQDYFFIEVESINHRIRVQVKKELLRAKKG